VILIWSKSNIFCLFFLLECRRFQQKHVFRQSFATTHPPTFGANKALKDSDRGTHGWLKL
jgi:hypothetical protein